MCPGGSSGSSHNVACPLIWFLGTGAFRTVTQETRSVVLYSEWWAVALAFLLQEKQIFVVVSQLEFGDVCCHSTSELR